MVDFRSRNFESSPYIVVRTLELSVLGFLLVAVRVVNKYQSRRLCVCVCVSLCLRCGIEQLWLFAFLLYCTTVLYKTTC
jgi:hypothetical protein